MPDGLTALNAFLAAAFLTLLSSAPVSFLARRWGMVSRGRPERAGPGGVPLLGGLAVIVGWIGGVAVAGLTGTLPLSATRSSAWLLLLLLAAGFGAIGGIDDRRGLDPVLRLLLELLVASLAIRVGCAILGVCLAALSVLFAALVITAAANAFNLTDNADGVAAGTGALTLLALSLWPVPGAAPLIWPAAAGALTGLFVLNRPPARLYLGDLGALAVGSWIGLGIWQRWDASAPGRMGAAGAAPALRALALLLVLGYTWIDPACAVLRRLGSRRAPWVGGVDHPSHDLRALWPSWSSGLAVILVAHAVSVAAGVAIARGWRPPLAASIGVLAWVALLLAARAGARRRNRAATAS